MRSRRESSMTSKRPGSVAWVGLATFAAAALGTLALVAFAGAPGSQAFVLAAAGFPSVGALIAARQPGNAVGWLLLGVGLGFGVNSVLTAYAGADGLADRTGAAPAGGWGGHGWVRLAGVVRA